MSDKFVSSLLPEDKIVGSLKLSDIKEGDCFVHSTGVLLRLLMKRDDMIALQLSSSSFVIGDTNVMKMLSFLEDAVVLSLEEYEKRRLKFIESLPNKENVVDFEELQNRVRGDYEAKNFPPQELQ